MNSFTIKDEIGTICIDNGPQNRLTRPAFLDHDEMKHQLKSKTCKAIIIHGEGRHFSAGADLEKLQEAVIDDSIAQKIEAGKKLLLWLKGLQIPLIGCIEGVCFGGGLEIVLHSDIRICSTKALLAFPETNLELIPALNGIINTCKTAGQDVALELVLSGDTIDADTALKNGLVDRLCQPKNAYMTGCKLAKKLISNRSINVINAVVELVRDSGTSNIESYSNRETEIFSQLARQANLNNEL